MLEVEKDKWPLRGQKIGSLLLEKISGFLEG